MTKYAVKRNKLNEAKKAIKELVEKVNDNEIGTWKYETFQISDGDNEFVHFATFRNEKAKEIHENSEHFKKFSKMLNSFCKERPSFMMLGDID